VFGRTRGDAVAQAHGLPEGPRNTWFSEDLLSLFLLYFPLNFGAQASSKSRFHASKDEICATFNVVRRLKKFKKWTAKPRFYTLPADYQALLGAHLAESRVDEIMHNR
jgi:hypothetical protein